MSSPKNTLNRATGGKEEGHRRHRRRREPPIKACLTIKKEKKKKKKKKKRSKRLKLDEEEAKKSLYICYLEHHPDRSVSYVVRSINLFDLLSSNEDAYDFKLRQVGYKSGDELPGSVGCGVWGSQIVFAAGNKPCNQMSFINRNTVWHRDVYAFETDPNKNKEQVITKLDGTLVQAKYLPWMVELGGKLYALSYRLVADPPSFEVFDPKVGRWVELPQPPFFERNGRYLFNSPLSYAVSGTKMFVSHEHCPVFCFDVAHPDREWRLVASMCRRGPFPFRNEALVLDLPVDNKKIMFADSHHHWRLDVYLMCLEENNETIKQIGDFKLPMLPQEYEFAKRVYFVHIGAQKACIVAPELVVHDQQENELFEAGTHKTRGVAIPFQFEVDISKIHKDEKNCFTLRFMPTRIFKFYTNPSSFPDPEASGCFVL